ncbi:MAG: single-stranded DNA-binding protein [Acidobacteria bacterium]|nr:MAG: single-stranded DNA-binding protein [Acidobacteriota bacterium]
MKASVSARVNRAAIVISRASPRTRLMPVASDTAPAALAMLGWRLMAADYRASAGRFPLAERRPAGALTPGAACARLPARAAAREERRPMASLAKVILIGNLGRDAELRRTPGGTTLADFSIATNERWTDKNGTQQEHTQWFRVTLWGRQAEALAPYLTKGKQVYVDGTLRAREYTDRDGNRRTSLDVRADTITLLGRAGEAPVVPEELQQDDGEQTDADIPF